MKKYILTTALCLAAMLPSFAQQTKRVMTVVQKDGTKTEYKVSSVQNVTFTDVELASLSNQWAYNDDVQSINKVTMQDAGDAYVFSIFGADAETANLAITMPKTLMGKSVELGSENAEGVAVAYNGKDAKLSGTLQARFDKTKKNVSINLQAETADYSDLRCRWSGAFAQVYTASNSIKVTNVSEVGNYQVASALMLKPATVGAATTFAFGDAEATTADGLLAGKAAVAVGISASKLYNGTIDMAADADSYTFKYVDYATRIVYEKVKAGTITTARDNDGKLYIKVNATLDDNRTVELEYYGNTTEVESLDAMIPAAVAENAFKYYNADGDVTINKNIGTSYLDEYKGKLTFLFVPEGESKSSYYAVTLKVSSDVINAGEIDLATLAEATSQTVFDFKFNAGGITLNSYALAGKYGLLPQQGTMKITKGEDGVYEIALDITNKYINSGIVRNANTRIVLNYKGTFEAN